MAEPAQTPVNTGDDGGSLALTSSQLGKYRLIAELGRGGMADVFLAVAPGPGGFNKLLVIKLLRERDDAFLVTMFLDEAKIAARASHPNIVQTFEVVQENGRAFIVMEYLDGPSLSRLRRAALKQGHKLPLDVELHIAREALKGLHAVHELQGFDGAPLNVVHRDFTPQNLMTTMAGDAKIVDFGIAKATDQAGKTSAGMFKGKLSYVPPEQLLGEKVDRRADIFAAGVMLYEAVTGASPWAGKTNAQITHLLATSSVPQLIEHSDAPPELAAIVDQAMAVDPDDRYSTADEMRIALDGFIREHHLEIDRAVLGHQIQGLLGETSAATRRLIEAQLKVVPQAPTASLPALDAMTPAPAEKMLGRSLPQLMESEQLPDTGRAVATGLPPTGTTGSVVSVVTQASPATRAVIGIIAGVVVGLVIAVGVLLNRTPAATAPLSAVVVPAAVPTAAPLPPRPVEPSQVEALKPTAPARLQLRLSATPANATLTLDGLELPSNPFEGSFPMDDALHDLRVNAPGCIEQRRGVQFDRDTAIAVSLVVAPAPDARASPITAVKKTAVKNKSGKSEPDTDSDYFAPPPTEKKPPKRTLDNVEFE